MDAPSHSASARKRTPRRGVEQTWRRYRQRGRATPSGGQPPRQYTTKTEKLQAPPDGDKRCARDETWPGAGEKEYLARGGGEGVSLEQETHDDAGFEQRKVLAEAVARPVDKR